MTIKEPTMVPTKRQVVTLKDPIQTQKDIVETVSIRAPVAKDIIRHLPDVSFKDFSEMGIKFADAWELAKSCIEDRPMAVLDKASMPDMMQIVTVVINFLGGGEDGSRPQDSSS